MPAEPRPRAGIDEPLRPLPGAIGAGGMAEVWLAQDQQLGRRVALKLLYRRFAEDPEFVERFRREASAAAGLQHPNVVRRLRPRRVRRHLLHRDGVPRGHPRSSG